MLVVVIGENRQMVDVVGGFHQLFWSPHPAIAIVDNISLFSLAAKGIGCFRDTGRRAIATMEGRSRLLKGHYRRRRDAIRKCALAAYRRGYRVFAVQHGGWCASAKRAHLTYGRYGRSNKCRNGKGGPWANDVYILKGRNIQLPS